MKKAILAIVFLVATAVIALADSAHADQGYYGYVLTTVDGVNNLYVSNAVITVYDSGNNQVAQTTASICGYYSVAVPSGGNHKLAVGPASYNLREVGNCGNIVATESVAGSVTNYVFPGFWDNVNIEVY